MNLLTLDKINKRYHQHLAVDQVSFVIPKGKIFGILGPNGAGKTSIIRIITAITKADSGNVLFDGEPLRAIHREQIGYMPEERGLYRKMRVGEQLLYLARLKGLKKKEAQKRIDFWFDRFDIHNWYKKKVEELSKGMQQKIQFIATVIHEPKLLILDEPFSGLDPVNTNLIRHEIDELNKKGTTILFSTHRMEQVEQICEEIVLINKGRNVLNGTVEQIKQQHKEHLFEINYKGALKDDVSHRFNLVRAEEGKICIQLEESMASNDILRYFLDQSVEIISFEELLPSLNEIFINIVKEGEDE